jgi:hypothetical protein
MAWTSPRTWVAAEVVTAALLNTHVRDNLKAIGDAWTTYVPTYTGITAIGNATVVAKYMQAGKLVQGYVKITVGSTTTFGATTLSVTTPVTPAIGNLAIGSIFLYDNSTGDTRGGSLYHQAAGTGTTGFLASGTTTPATNLVPWTWATSDIIAFSFTYEAA